MPKKAAVSGKDCFGDLPDDLLRHLLLFLPPADALQTCVLDTRWRDHWRRTTDLLLFFEESSFPSSERFKQLVKLFIRLRGNSPLDKFEIGASVDGQERMYTNATMLIEYALKCQAKDLLVFDGNTVEEPPTLNVHLISQHLKTIDLYQVSLQGPTLNFSRCPVLDDLKMKHCSIGVRMISSKSLKRLCIADFCTFSSKFHVRISAPGLISLQLDDFIGLTPSLEYMPFLITAFVGLGKDCDDFCLCDRVGYKVPYCSCDTYPVEEGVLLHGLSNAVNLELIMDAHYNEMFIYRWDLKWCPIFDKLKTLLLNEWFTTIDLVCILQHSPVLEMLTLQLGDTKNLLGATGFQETIEQSFVCAHLKVVNIECIRVDERIHKILKILCTCGIIRERISIKDQCSHSYCFSFQKSQQPLLSSTAAPVSVSSTNGT